MLIHSQAKKLFKHLKGLQNKNYSAVYNAFMEKGTRQLKKELIDFFYIIEKEMVVLESRFCFNTDQF